MTPERITELRALEVAATPGPWTWVGYGHTGPGNAYMIAGPIVTEEESDRDDYQAADEIITTDGGFYGPNVSDRVFIAAARTALPEALDALERIWALLEKHYHTSGIDSVSSTDVFLALSGEPRLYKRNARESE